MVTRFFAHLCFDDKQRGQAAGRRPLITTNCQHLWLLVIIKLYTSHKYLHRGSGGYCAAHPLGNTEQWGGGGRGATGGAGQPGENQLATNLLLATFSSTTA